MSRWKEELEMRRKALNSQLEFLLSPIKDKVKQISAIQDELREIDTLLATYKNNG